MAIGEAIHAVGTEDPTCFRTAEPDVYNPPSLAEIAKGRGDRQDFENLDALSADGSDPPVRWVKLGSTWLATS